MLTLLGASPGYLTSVRVFVIGLAAILALLAVKGCLWRRRHRGSADRGGT
jgi:hypothetical protein